MPILFHIFANEERFSMVSVRHRLRHLKPFLRKGNFFESRSNVGAILASCGG
jgi:hypothetical protein